MLTRNAASDWQLEQWSLVVSAYLDESISLAKAAELLGYHPIELRKLFLEKGIPLHLGPNSKEDAQAEVDALRASNSTIDEN
jgi:predicted HTH domain antitoxin